MTCRHAQGDRSCGTQYPQYQYQAPPTTPDAEKYEILDAVHVESKNRFVMKIRYPNCSLCAYEGTKVLVYADVTALMALKWRRVDPHFRDPKAAKSSPTAAPSPIARFPANVDGWNAAIWFANNC
jgi:hypothetical protein